MLKYGKRFLMGQARLFDYLKKLDADDLKQIKKYLVSPFFKVHSRDRVIVLFDALRGYHPLYDVNDDQLATKLGIANKKQIGNLKVNLRKCIEDYLRQSQIRGNEQLQVLLLADGLDDLDLTESLKKFANDALKELSTKKALTAYDYYLKHQLLKKLYIAKSSFGSDNLFLSDAMETLSYFYLYENLNSLSSYKTLSKVLKREGMIELTLNIINSVKNYQTIEDPNISISYYIYQFHTSEKIADKEKIFEQIKAITKKDGKQLTSFYKHEVYIFMINAAKRIASIKMSVSYKEIYKIHKFWISKNVHLTYNELDENVFISIVKDYCHASQFKKCKKFIQKNKGFLSPNEKQATIDFCEAYAKFGAERYEDAMQLFSKVKFKNVILKINQKIIELKCSYELNNDLIFSARYKSTIQFINRQKDIEKDWGTMYLKFVQYLNKIMEVKKKKGYIDSTENYSDLLLLENKVKIERSILGRIWLLEAIKKLKGLI